MNTLKSLNFGIKGWILLAYQFVGFVGYTVFTNYPMNMLLEESNHWQQKYICGILNITYCENDCECSCSHKKT